jgi:hypothetical protein
MSRRLVLIALLTAMLAGGCSKQRPSRIRFNDMLARNTKKVAILGSSFRIELQKLLTPSEGTPTADPAVLERIFNDLESTAKQLRRDADDIVLPKRSENLTSDFLSAYKAYLDAQITIIQTQVPQIIAVVRKGKAASDASKKAEIERILTRIDAEERKTKEALDQAQRALAGECKFMLVEKKTRLT